MNAKQLLARFERISEAPGAIPRLRDFILELAVAAKAQYIVTHNLRDFAGSDTTRRYG